MADEDVLPPLVYNKADAAEQLSISVRVLDRLLRDGEVASVQIGRRAHPRRVAACMGRRRRWRRGRWLLTLPGGEPVAQIDLAL